MTNGTDEAWMKEEEEDRVEIWSQIRGDCMVMGSGEDGGRGKQEYQME